MNIVITKEKTENCNVENFLLSQTAMVHKNYDTFHLWKDVFLYSVLHNPGGASLSLLPPDKKKAPKNPNTNKSETINTTENATLVRKTNIRIGLML